MLEKYFSWLERLMELAIIRAEMLGMEYHRWLENGNSVNRILKSLSWIADKGIMFAGFYYLFQYPIVHNMSIKQSVFWLFETPKMSINDSDTYSYKQAADAIKEAVEMLINEGEDTMINYIANSKLREGSITKDSILSLFNVI